MRWGVDSGVLDHFAPIEDEWTILATPPPNSSQRHVPGKMFCGSVAVGQGWREPGWYHSAVFDFSVLDLTKPTRVYYTYGSDGGGWAALKSAMASNMQSTPSTMLLLADVGTGDWDGSRGGGWQTAVRCAPGQMCSGDYPGATTVLNNLAKRHQELSMTGQPSMTLHLGDISYAEGYDIMWALFMRMIEPSATLGPYAVAQGNHERDWEQSGSFYDSGDSWGECGVAVAQRFPLPSGVRSTVVDYYAFINGPMRWVVINTELPLQPGTTQYEWLVHELEAVNRSQTPFLIVGGHRDMYSLARNNDPKSNINADILEPLFFKHGVDIVFMGHIHSASVTCPLYNATCLPRDKGGVTYILMANGGITINGGVPPPNSSQIPDWLLWGNWNDYGHTEVQATHSNLNVQMWLSESNASYAGAARMAYELNYKPRPLEFYDSW